MNITQMPLPDVTLTLAAWLNPLVIESQRPQSDCGATRWRVTEQPQHPEEPTNAFDSDGCADAPEVSLRMYPHLNAIGISFTLPLPACPRLTQLELLAALNDDVAFARFSMPASGGLVGEYMMDCAGEAIPSGLEPMVRHFLALPESVRGVLEAWRLTPETSLAPPARAMLLS